MTPLDPSLVFGDLLRVALDDCQVRLDVGVERAVVSRMVELVEVAGVELVREKL